jgi:hypothetical protein
MAHPFNDHDWSGNHCHAHETALNYFELMAEGQTAFWYRDRQEDQK